jgi:hypothetical protein
VAVAALVSIIGTVFFLLLLLGGGAVVVWGVLAWQKSRNTASLADARAEARRWVERLGGQVMSLTATDDASRQALADASERYTAAGSQVDQATTSAQCRLATQTALEGLHYIRAARVAMGLDPGPELPATAEQRGIRAITEDREVTVEGHRYSASPRPSGANSHYYPGGHIHGRPVPSGWYSQPWWKTALVAGAAGVGSMMLADALFSGFGSHGGGDWSEGYESGYDTAMDSASGAVDALGDGGGWFDMGGLDVGDLGGDLGGGDFF